MPNSFLPEPRLSVADVFARARRMQQDAWRVIEATDIVGLWEAAGARVNLVGSLKTGLLVRNRDIDFHLYTDPFRLQDDFAVMAHLAEQPGVREIHYANLLDVEDRCIEWHACCEGPDGAVWRIDMIHILVDSPYAGYFEQVAARLDAVLDLAMREAILRIKLALPAERKVMSILVYQAVVEGGVRTLEAFLRWLAAHEHAGIVTWMP